jgi:1,2-dihydroxy-3-keto-5-methylthiopentene dioxygenase
MSVLWVYRDDTKPEVREEYTDLADITRTGAEAGITFERWAAPAELPPDASPAELMTAYSDAAARLKRERGFVTSDVIAVTAAHPNHPELRKKFMDEHIHAEDEARFFVDGSGLFTIHHERGVYALLCEKGDLINVPAGTRHWFDMGGAPSFKCIRLFRNPEGWIAEFTGSDIAGRFPRYGE